MKKTFLVAFSCLTVFIAQAKKVKFSVDMTGQTISVDSVHVFGDFQAAAGFATGDWDPGSTLLTQEGSSNIYSVIVDIPAFKKYEYKFLNGNLSYNVEWVPEQSRVGYNFNDNRWIYVDSLKNDTTFVGAIMYSSNAPTGLKLMRFLVDMSNESSIDSTDGIHIAGSFQGWSTTATRLYSFGSNIYEIIAYGDSTTGYQYKFYNGNNSSNTEIVPTTCATSGNRTLTPSTDTVLASVCFSSCSACVTNGIQKITSSINFEMFPNPSNENVTLLLNESMRTVIIKDALGKTIQQYENLSTTSLQLNNLAQGVYFVQVYATNKQSSIQKLIITN